MRWANLHEALDEWREFEAVAFDDYRAAAGEAEKDEIVAAYNQAKRAFQLGLRNHLEAWTASAPPTPTEPVPVPCDPIALRKMVDDLRSAWSDTMKMIATGAFSEAEQSALLTEVAEAEADVRRQLVAELSAWEPPPGEALH